MKKILCKKEGCNVEAIECSLVDNKGNEHIEHLCPTHAIEEGYCGGCGYFYAGTNEFDFKHPGYCDNCYYEIRENFE